MNAATSKSSSGRGNANSRLNIGGTAYNGAPGLSVNSNPAGNVILGSSVGGLSQGSNFNSAVRAPPGIGISQQQNNHSMYGVLREGESNPSNAHLQPVGQAQGQNPLQHMSNGSFLSSSQPGANNSSGGQQSSRSRLVGLGGSSTLGSYDGLSGGSAPGPTPFDLADFPSLSNQTGASSVLNESSSNQLPYAMHLSQHQHNTAFAMQKEDFPALPGGFTNPHLHGSSDKDAGHSNFGFRQDTQGQQQQQQIGGDAVGSNQSQLFERRHQQMPSAKVNRANHSAARGVMSQVHEQSPFGTVSSEAGMSGLASSGGLKLSSNSLNANRMSTKAPPANASDGSPGNISFDSSNPNQKYGLLGLLGVIRMEDADRGTLALGTDLTTLGLNLNSSDALHTTFASPWAEGPSTRDPKFQIPACYLQASKGSNGKSIIKPSHFGQFQLESLFYIFYLIPRDAMQVLAAQELYKRDWRYHMDYKLWFAKDNSGTNKTNSSGPDFLYFDLNSWERRVFNGVLPGRGADAFLREELINAALNPSAASNRGGAQT